MASYLGVNQYQEKKNIPKKEHPHRDLSTTLRFGRDDKGEGGDLREE
jgi:hypothetical protein